MDFFILSFSAEYLGHSSNTITMSEFKSNWTCMLSSGVKKNFLPSIWELNSTPSSVTFEIFDKDIT